jgi:hypothetical protein
MRLQHTWNKDDPKNRLEPWCSAIFRSRERARTRRMSFYACGKDQKRKSFNFLGSVESVGEGIVSYPSIG